MKKEWRIAYHGTYKKERAKQILKDGFKKGTYFARHLEDSLEFGGKYIFSVALKISGDNWQIVAEAKIPPERITRLICVNPKELYLNNEAGKVFPQGKMVPCSECGTDIGHVRLSLFGKPVVARCPGCKERFN